MYISFHLDRYMHMYVCMCIYTVYIYIHICIYICIYLTHSFLHLSSIKQNKCWVSIRFIPCIQLIIAPVEKNDLHPNSFRSASSVSQSTFALYNNKQLSRDQSASSSCSRDQMADQSFQQRNVSGPSTPEHLRLRPPPTPPPLLSGGPTGCCLYK